MHKFERFIVYPLLILALFYSMAGEQIHTTAEEVIDKLTVREISIINDNGKEVVNIADAGGILGGEISLKHQEKEVISLFATPSGGMLNMYLVEEGRKNSTGITISSVRGDSGSILISNKNEENIIELASNNDNGGIWLYDNEGNARTCECSLTLAKVY